MTSKNPRSFVVRVATAMMFGMPVPALHIPGVDTAEAQTIQSQPNGGGGAIDLVRGSQQGDQIVTGRSPCLAYA
jgi:hypothetical protein